MHIALHILLFSKGIKTSQVNSYTFKRPLVIGISDFNKVSTCSNFSIVLPLLPLLGYIYCNSISGLNTFKDLKMGQSLEEPSKKKERLFFFTVAFTFLIGTALVYSMRFNGPPIRSDGMGYYAYLPAMFIYEDLGMDKYVAAYASYYGIEKPTYFLGLKKQENSSNYLDKYPIGVAVMMTPFFLVAHGITLAIQAIAPEIKADGFSSPFYHYIIAFGSTLYLFLGLILLKKILNPYFRQKTIYITLIALLFATNLFHYGTYDSVFSHAYSFFLFAAFILLTQKWFERPSYKTALFLGLVTGLIVLVRPTNILVVMFFLCYNFRLTEFKSFAMDQVSLFWKHRGNLMLLLMVSALMVSLQLLYWRAITGHWIVFSYEGEYFDFQNPQLLNVLFSVHKGLFFWAPLLLCIVPGFYFMRERKELHSFLIPLIAYFALTVYLIASWWCWSYGGSYGHRGFIESFVVLAFPMAAFYEKVMDITCVLLRRIIWLVSFACIVFNLYLMFQYWRGFIPFDNTTIEIFNAAVRNKDMVK